MKSRKDCDDEDDEKKLQNEIEKGLMAMEASIDGDEVQEEEKVELERKAEEPMETEEADKRDWKFWCYQCEEILQTEPIPRADGSLDCPKCCENIVEKFSPDDVYLKAMVEEEKKDNQPAPGPPEGPLLRAFEGMQQRF